MYHRIVFEDALETRFASIEVALPQQTPDPANDFFQFTIRVWTHNEQMRT
jgi:hypothetical protein